MGKPRTKGALLTKTAESHALEVMNRVLFKREPILENKYLMKGRLCEEDALQLVSNVLNIFLIKNKDRYTNDYIAGTPDYCEKFVLDTKASWSMNTFERAEMTKEYEWQIKAYCWLTGHTKGVLAYTLVNAPAYMITDEIRKAWYSMNCPEDDDANYIRVRQKIERNMIFDRGLFDKENPGYEWQNEKWEWDMPEAMRVKFFKVEATQEDFDVIQEQVEKARTFLEQYWEQNYSQKAKTDQFTDIINYVL